LWGKKFVKVKLKRGTIFSIAATLLFTLAGLTWISFVRQGSLLIRLNSLLVSQLGVFATAIIPIPMFSGGLMLTKIKTWLGRPHTFVGSLLLSFSVMGLGGGGEIGRQLWLSISALFSVWGAGLVYGMGIFIGLMVMFDVPLEDVVKMFQRLSLPKSVDLKQVQINPLKLNKPQLPTAVAKREIKIGGMGESKPKASDFNVASPQAMVASNIVWKYPPLSILSENISGKADRGDVRGNAAIIEQTLEAFGISAKVVEVNGGPAVTQYALEVAIGTKLSKISALSNDLALALAAPTGQIRIEAPIPGRSLVGIELPNKSPEFVSLRKMLESDAMHGSKSKLAVSLGLEVSGKPVVADISKMPHVLIAGSTGSGKSVCINAFIASILFRASPDEVRFIMVDPKRVELNNYNGIPHLLSPVIVDPEKVLSALKWLTIEMDRRYKLFAEVGVRNIDAYNEMSGFQSIPYIILIIDELADIMLFAPVEVEDTITRLAQMSRATGIHLVLATQRPSVDVITGLIKANIPARIAFAVSSMIDSRVILDAPGAEKLLGRGDMLFIPPGQAKPSRIQGAFVSDKEVSMLIDFLKKQGVQPNYTEEVTSMPVSTKNGRGGNAFISPNGESRDALFEEAVRIVVQNDKASASLLQRKLSVGYARAARMLDELEQAGIVSHAEGSKPRDVLTKGENV
jgi:S-DNA-T family DNA segregation ATPase FtsK/SpoIIIE